MRTWPNWFGRWQTSILSRSMELKPGDVIMTGTPSSVGAIVAGDKVVGGIDGLDEIDIAVGGVDVRLRRSSRHRRPLSRPSLVHYERHARARRRIEVEPEVRDGGEAGCQAGVARPDQDRE
jgi:Fumarylacetoacetate (FAA) hydrolase family